MADVLLKQANLSEIPLRVLSTLPSTLPSAGYAHLLAKDTVDGKRAYLRLPDGSLVNLFTVNTVVDNTITNNNNTTVYQISDLPNPTTLTAGSIPTVVDNAGVKSWGWNLITSLIYKQSIQAHRAGHNPTTTQTLQGSDADSYLNCTNSSAIVLTIPVSSANVFDVVYTELEVAQNGTGTVTVTPASGVTINGTTASVVVPARYKVISLKLIAANTWVAYGV
jgi:hypothetical protein